MAVGARFAGSRLRSNSGGGGDAWWLVFGAGIGRVGGLVQAGCFKVEQGVGWLLLWVAAMAVCLGSWWDWEYRQWYCGRVA
mmetsp:Transcript_13508/g.33116  ORF Transcript_13508/g.33116 Transcript_13508/m.33116 type:complete len:81 (+) Transcript_13508:642-884(+)